MRTTFLVGRLTRRGAEMVVADGNRRLAPFPGPWSLRAVVRTAPSLPVPGPRDDSTPTITIH